MWTYFNQQTPGGYAIFKDNGIIGVIEVVDNVKTANLESIRQNTLSNNVLVKIRWIHSSFPIELKRKN